MPRDEAWGDSREETSPWPVTLKPQSQEDEGLMRGGARDVNGEGVDGWLSGYGSSHGWNPQGSSCPLKQEDRGPRSTFEIRASYLDLRRKKERWKEEREERMEEGRDILATFLRQIML